MFNFIYVALGGACGAMGRYAISLIPTRTSLPLLTFATNVLGAVIIGFIIGVASSKGTVSKEMMLFLKVGICGGFTTFSTFSVEVLNLFGEGRAVLGIMYAFISVVCCIIGVYVGQMIANKVV